MTDNLTPEELDEIERQEQEAFRNAVNGVETEDEEDVVEDQVQPDEPATEVTPEVTTEVAAPEDPLISMERRIVGSIESTLNNKLRSVDARLGRLSNDFSQLSQAAKVAKESGAAAPSNSQITAATTDAKRKQLKEEFPEWAEALDELQAEMVSRIPKIDFTQQMKLEQKFSQQLEGQKLEAQRQAFLARQMARLDMEYPDWEATIVSEPYKQWLSQQPEEVKVLTNSERAVDALRVLDAYSQATSPSATNQPAGNSRLIGNRKRLESAITPTQGRAPARSSTKTEHEEFLEAFRS